jgi:hypothetical protein
MMILPSRGLAQNSTDTLRSLNLLYDCDARWEFLHACTDTSMIASSS